MLSPQSERSSTHPPPPPVPPPDVPFRPDAAVGEVVPSSMWTDVHGIFLSMIATALIQLSSPPPPPPRLSLLVCLFVRLSSFSSACFNLLVVSRISSSHPRHSSSSSFLRSTSSSFFLFLASPVFLRRPSRRISSPQVVPLLLWTGLLSGDESEAVLLQSTCCLFPPLSVSLAPPFPFFDPDALGC